MDSESLMCIIPLVLMALVYVVGIVFAIINHIEEHRCPKCGLLKVFIQRDIGPSQKIVNGYSFAHYGRMPLYDVGETRTPYWDYYRCSMCGHKWLKKFGWLTGKKQPPPTPRLCPNCDATNIMFQRHFQGPTVIIEKRWAHDEDKVVEEIPVAVTVFTDHYWCRTCNHRWEEQGRIEGIPQGLTMPIP